MVIAPLPAPHSMLDLVAGAACAVVLPSGHKLWKPPTDVAQPAWQRQLVVPAGQCKSVFEVFRDDQGKPYVLPVVAVTPKGFQLGGEAPLEAVFTGLWQLLAVGLGPDGVPDLKGAMPFGIVAVDLAAREILTDAPPAGPGLPQGDWHPSRFRCQSPGF